MPVDEETTAFEDALMRVFDLEGGWSDHASDRGGATKFGISLRYLRDKGVGGGGDIDLDGDVDAADVLALRPEHARAFYRSDFWVPSGADRAARHSQKLATKMFEFAVVSGPTRSVRALQSALCDCGHKVAVDGSYGGKTDAAIWDVRLNLQMDLLYCALQRRCAEHFLNIIAGDRSQAAFLVGWLRRALDLDR